MTLDSGVIHLGTNMKNHNEYFDHILAYNQNLLLKARKELEFLITEKDYCICTTGSDSRLEKGPISLFELMLISREKDDESNKALQYLDKLINSSEKYHPNIEWKTILKNAMSTFLVESNDGTFKDIPSPNRVFDLQFISGNRKLYDFSKSQLIQEILMPEYGNYLYRNAKNRLRQHKKTTSSGIQRFKKQDIVQYDLEKGFSIYDPEKKIWSFKQGPLRLVQYSIVRDIIKGIRNNGAGFPNLPRNTVLKLRYLETDNQTLMSSDEISDLTDCYKFFIWEYHKSQENYQENQQTRNQFDKKEVQERIDSVAKICSKQILDYKS